MQQNHDSLLARTETLISHCICIMAPYLKAGTNNYINILIKASETLVFSNCTGLILVFQVMAENRHGYHVVMYLGCQVEQTFLS